MIRIVNVCMIVAALFGYNHVTLAHEKIDAEAKALLLWKCCCCP